MDDKKFDRCKEAVCIQTKQIYDSCKAKECLENLRVHLTCAGQSIVDNAVNVKVVETDLIWIFSDVEPVQFNKGFYTVELTYFFKITLDVFTAMQAPRRVSGLAVYDKKIVLFGSEGNAKIFTSKYREKAFDIQKWKKTNLPEAIVETVDPMALSVKLVDACDPCCNCCCDSDMTNVPECVARVFDDALVLSGDNKRVLVTLGIFTIVKLARNTQLLIPAYDFCVPDKECVSSSDENPCELFETLNFPVDEFFPPTKCDFGNSGCGCD